MTRIESTNMSLVTEDSERMDIEQENQNQDTELLNYIAQDSFLSLKFDIYRSLIQNSSLTSHFSNADSSFKLFFVHDKINDKEIETVIDTFMDIYTKGIEFKHLTHDVICCKEKNILEIYFSPKNLAQKVKFRSLDSNQDQYHTTVSFWITEFMLKNSQNFIQHDVTYRMSDYLEIDDFENPVINSPSLLIGQGGFGEVFKNRLFGKQVVIKLSKRGINKFILERIVKEYRYLTSLNHQNVIRCYGILKYENSIGIVLEYCQNGNLKSYLKNHEMSYTKRLAVSTKLIEALNFLHLKSVCHLDIKPENVFLDQNLEVKIGDFGLSLINEEHDARSLGFSLHFSAPEILKKTEYSPKSDIWSLGMTLYWFLVRKVPFHYLRASKVTNFNKAQNKKLEKEDFIYHIVECARRPEIGDAFLKENPMNPIIADIIRQTWDLLPSSRPSAAQILRLLQPAS